MLEGGGIRGVAYCGALQELEQRGMLHSIRRIGGTSAGAIQALLLSVGYSAAELTDLVSEMKVESFNDGQYIFVGGAQRLMERFGWYRGDAFRRWIGEKIDISEAANRASFRPEDLKRTISIDFQNVGVKVRKLSLLEKNTLIESGKKGVCDFCKPTTTTSEN